MRLFEPRLQAQRQLVLGPGLINFTLVFQAARVEEMRFRIIRIVAQGLPVKFHRLVRIAVVRAQAPQQREGQKIILGDLPGAFEDRSRPLPVVDLDPGGGQVLASSAPPHTTMMNTPMAGK